MTTDIMALAKQLIDEQSSSDIKNCLKDFTYDELKLLIYNATTNKDAIIQKEAIIQWKSLLSEMPTVNDHYLKLMLVVLQRDLQPETQTVKAIIDDIQKAFWRIWEDTRCKELFQQITETKSSNLKRTESIYELVKIKDEEVKKIINKILSPYQAHAEDAYQSVWQHVLNISNNKFNPTYSFNAWFAKVITNFVLGYYNKLKAQSLRHSPLVDEALPSNNDVHKEYEDGVFKKRLEEFIQSLPPKKQRIFQGLLNGMSEAEMQASEKKLQNNPSLSLGAIKSLRHSVRELFRNAFKVRS